MLRDTITIEFPQQRRELLRYLSNLSDIEYQRREWIGSPNEITFWSNMLYSIHFIFDDLNFGSGDEWKKIGPMLYNQEEVDAVMKFVNTWDHAMNVIGDKKEDRAYIDSPLWDDVVRTAKEAHDLLVKNDERVKNENG